MWWEIGIRHHRRSWDKSYWWLHEPELLPDKHCTEWTQSSGWSVLVFSDIFSGSCTVLSRTTQWSSQQGFPPTLYPQRWRHSPSCHPATLSASSSLLAVASVFEFPVHVHQYEMLDCHFLPLNPGASLSEKPIMSESCCVLSGIQYNAMLVIPLPAFPAGYWELVCEQESTLLPAVSLTHNTGTTTTPPPPSQRRAIQSCRVVAVASTGRNTEQRSRKYQITCYKL